MKGDRQRLSFLSSAIVMMVAGSLFAFQPIPKESAKALGVTRGKPFSSGMVFVDGKYIEPPYVVERWGTGIRINSIPVTGQVVNWTEFLKTQEGVKVEKQEISAPAPRPVPAVPTAVAYDITAKALDDLFDDDPKPEEPKPVPQPVAAPAPAPKTVTTYVLDGEFKPNDASKALLAKINASRTGIDRILRSDGFICFGNGYSRVTGDKRTMTALLEKLPELEQRSKSVESFLAGARAANLVYLNEVLCEDLFNNRVDYRKLKERREKNKSDQKWNQALEDVVDPIF